MGTSKVPVTILLQVRLPTGASVFLIRDGGGGGIGGRKSRDVPLAENHAFIHSFIHSFVLL